MGESIVKGTFSEKEQDLFRKKLREETLVLKKYFEGRTFEYEEVTRLGLEVEAWLVDSDSLPSPSNEKFLKLADNPELVEEISQFNFEVNTHPQYIQKNVLTQLHQSLGRTWEACIEVAGRLQLNPVLVGIHPLVRDEMLQLQYISEGHRYQVLNDQIFKWRQNQPINIDIQGLDHFQMKLDHILIEAAATSIQVHLQANQEDFKRLYNASLIASAPCVALAANSPYLYGHELWDETRIPLFEQSIQLKQFRDKKGQDVGRVTFGTGYVRHSALELFIENLDAYPPLLPVLFDDPPEQLHHLRFHNGTLWRWNRPIIGINADGKHHLRIEQRAMASGPSLIDIVANVAFSLGLTRYYSRLEKAPEESMTFTDCRKNFYQSAKKGLSAQVRWFGQQKPLATLILEELIPQAEKGLLDFGVSQAEVDYYLKDIIYHRVFKGQNGAHWQKAFIATYGKDFQALSQAYLAHQKSGVPVHRWPL